MELIVSLKGGYKVECAGCLRKIKISDAKVINHKCYCPTCYPLIKSKKDDTDETTDK